MSYLLKVHFITNPDIKQGWWHPELIHCTQFTAVCSSLLDAWIILYTIMEKQVIGAGNLHIANVFKQGEFIGRFSYNGRFWDIDDNEIKYKE